MACNSDELLAICILWIHSFLCAYSDVYHVFCGIYIVYYYLCVYNMTIKIINRFI